MANPYASALLGQDQGGDPYVAAASMPRSSLAQALMQQSMDTSPIRSPWQGVSRMAQALVGQLMANQQNAPYVDAAKNTAEALRQGLGTPDTTWHDPGTLSQVADASGGTVPAVTGAQDVKYGGSAPDFNAYLRQMAMNPMTAQQVGPLIGQMQMAQVKGKIDRDNELVKQGVGVTGTDQATGLPTTAPLPGYGAARGGIEGQMAGAKTAGEVTAHTALDPGLIAATAGPKASAAYQEEAAKNPALVARAGASAAAENPALIARAGGVAAAENPALVARAVQSAAGTAPIELAKQKALAQFQNNLDKYTVVPAAQFGLPDAYGVAVDGKGKPTVWFNPNEGVKELGPGAQIIAPAGVMGGSRTPQPPLAAGGPPIAPAAPGGASPTMPVGTAPPAPAPGAMPPPNPAIVAPPAGGPPTATLPPTGAAPPPAASPAYNVVATSPNPSPGTQPGHIDTYLADTFKGHEDTAAKGRDKLANMGLVNQMLGDVDTGKFTGNVLDLMKTARAAGLSTDGMNEKMGKLEAASALSKQLALEGRNFPGAVSNYEQKLLQSMAPGLETTPQGRQGMLEIAQQRQQRNEAIAKMGRDYLTEPVNGAPRGRLDVGYLNALEQYARTNGLTGLHNGPSSAAAPTAATAAAPPTVSPAVAKQADDISAKFYSGAFGDPTDPKVKAKVVDMLNKAEKGTQ